MKRSSAVIVDDVPELRRLLRHVLEWSERFEVVGEAGDGRKAIELAGELSPDVVLLDISMPIMDGMTALPKILEASPTTRVVMLSGFEADRLATTAVEMGAAAYIEKGTPPAALVIRLLEILGQEQVTESQQRREARQLLNEFSSEEMLALVAHEIRNPLAVIQGFGMELTNRWEAMPEHVRRDAVRRMTERARFLNTVVSNLMYMRKVQGLPESFDSTAEEVKPLLERMGDELKEMSRDNPLAVEVQEDLPPVKINVQRLRQVLTNLVVNAAKFSPSAAPIKILAEAHPRGVAIRVVDQGPGIPKDKREEIFEKFRRLETGGSGIGLGLYISRALMGSMDGEMWAEEGPGRGACLVCLMPIA